MDALAGRIPTKMGRREPDSYTEELLGSGPFSTRYISPDEATFKLAGLERWKWLWDALAECPEGQCVLIDVPEGHECARMANCIRSAVRTSLITGDWHWSVRQTKDEKGIVISRGRKWAKLTDTLEKQREEEIQQAGPRKVTRIRRAKPEWDRTEDGKLDEVRLEEPEIKIGIVEAIIAVFEDRGPVFRDELLDYVEELRPGTLRVNTHNQISIMIKDERIEKRSDQKLQLNAAIPMKTGTK